MSTPDDEFLLSSVRSAALTARAVASLIGEEPNGYLQRMARRLDVWLEAERLGRGWDEKEEGAALYEAELLVNETIHEAREAFSKWTGHPGKRPNFPRDRKGVDAFLAEVRRLQQKSAGEGGN